MTTSPQTAPTVCFAPEMTDEKLSKYEALIASLGSDQRRLKDYLSACFACVAAWMTLPESKRTDGRVFKSLTADGRGVACPEIPLEKEQIEQLWDVTPFPEDCEPMQRFFEKVQIDEHTRNSKKIEEWRSAVREACFAAAYPGKTRDQVYGQFKDLAVVLDIAKRYGEITPERDLAMIAVVFPGMTPEEFQAAVDKKKALEMEIKAACFHDGPSPIPKPALESEDLRNCAFDLLWHTMEIARDREPMSQEKVKYAELEANDPAE